MAPSFVNETHQETGSVTSNSFSFTPGAEVNLVVVAFAVFNTISGLSVTYAGAAMTLLDSYTSGTLTIWLYYLVNPPAGASTVSASWTTSRNSSLAARAYKGVNTTNPFGTVAKNAGTSTSASVNAASNPTELVIDAVVLGALNNLNGVSGGQSQEYLTNPNISSGGSNKAGAASVTMSWSLSTSSTWAIMAVPIRPQTSFFLMF